MNEVLWIIQPAYFCGLEWNCISFCHGIRGPKKASVRGRHVRSEILRRNDEKKTRSNRWKCHLRGFLDEWRREEQQKTKVLSSWWKKSGSFLFSKMKTKPTMNFKIEKSFLTDLMLTCCITSFRGRFHWLTIFLDIDSHDIARDENNGQVWFVRSERLRFDNEPTHRSLCH